MRLSPLRSTLKKKKAKCNCRLTSDDEVNEKVETWIREQAENRTLRRNVEASGAIQEVHRPAGGLCGSGIKVYVTFSFYKLTMQQCTQKLLLRYYPAVYKILQCVPEVQRRIK